MPKRKREPDLNGTGHEHQHEHKHGQAISPGKKHAREAAHAPGHNDTVAHMDAAMLSDHLAQNLKRHAANRSAIELEDQFIPASAIRDTTSFTEPRVSKHLPLFLRTFTNGPEDLCTCDEPASPRTIIVTASGIRAADLARELRSLATDDYKIAKLFAKHMKLQATIDFVQRNKVIIGVGTPTRLKELIDQDVLKAPAIKRIVVDGSYVDEKKRTIFDMPEIYLPMLDLLNMAISKSKSDFEIVIF